MICDRSFDLFELDIGNVKKQGLSLEKNASVSCTIPIQPEINICIGGVFHTVKKERLAVPFPMIIIMFQTYMSIAN